MIERTFDVHWSDRASSEPIVYHVSRIVFHDGGWSARVRITNASRTSLYESTWADPENKWSEWDGPALVYSGHDVLGDRRLIYIPASTEQPAIPFPLRPGATWSGTISGKVPSKPPVPRGEPIWLRYPIFGIGRPWDGLTPSFAVQWISNKGVTL
jgi:hypothetical protein